MSAFRNLLHGSFKSNSAAGANTSQDLNSQEDVPKRVSQNGDSISRGVPGNGSYNQKGPMVDEPEADAENQPGELSFAEDTAGGMGRHLGLFSATFLVLVIFFVFDHSVSFLKVYYEI